MKKIQQYLSLTLFYTILLNPFYAQEKVLSSSVGVASHEDAEEIRKSVVKIEATCRVQNFLYPWQAGDIRSGVGSGFVIAPNKIITNAHVVSDAIRILVMLDRSAEKLPARVCYIAHDCDLALLELENPAVLKNVSSLPLGEIPLLNSQVTVYGYPIGGSRISITKGVVSRIEFHVYSHSGLDAHLAIQIDAAINPGNSGGPAIQDGKVIGIAFQGFSGAVAQNTGYIIPTSVIRRFLKDIEDGQYDGYVEVGINHLPLQNPALRHYLGIPSNKNNYGVFVYNVIQSGSCAGKIVPGDIILGVDDYPVDHTGNILLENERIPFEELAERKFYDEEMVFTILREQKEEKISIRLKPLYETRIFANQHEIKPRYILYAGILFQPLNKAVMVANQIKQPEINYYYNFFITDQIYKERKELVVITKILPDSINVGFRDMTPYLVDKINEITIQSLVDVEKAFQQPTTYHVIRLIGHPRPIVIHAKDLEEANKRIQLNYQIKSLKEL